jgi:hypothetical protein
LHPNRFAIIYATLAICVIGSIAGTTALALTPSTRAEIRHVQAQLGDTNLARIAEHYIAQAAQQQGLAVEKITVTKVDVNGDQAHVHATVVVTDGVSSQRVDLVVDIGRGVWQPSGVRQGQ